ncbi:Ig-like domain-containing protein [Phaeobacter marinintestinus]|uniref:Ig-like domain-containing protein n=1 Tax=Falsiphaeobacter marinintestinus TaxID=1492905 RepID=UPI0011B5FE27|nr:Ig-like domain-containing protein [Phaeobacter marinintestinus]
MTTVNDFSDAITSFFQDLETLALTELANREAALIGALDPHLDDLASPLRTVRDSLLDAVDGLNVADEEALAAALVDAISGAGIDGISATVVDGSVRLVLTSEVSQDLDGTASLANLQTAGLGLALDGVLDLTATANLDLVLLFDPSDGATGSLTIEDNATIDDVRLGLEATLDGSSLPDTVSLGFIQADTSLGEGTNGATVSVGLDLDGGTLDDQTPEVDIDAAARLAIGLDVGFESPFLPSIEGTLVIDYGSVDSDGVLGTLGGISLQEITLGIDAIDDLLDSVLGPLDDIASAFPLGPVINLLSAPLPVINDLAGFLDQNGDDDVTLVDLLTAFSSGDQDYAFVETVVTIAEVLGTLGDIADQDGVLLGEITFSADAIQALLGGENGSDLGQIFEFSDFDSTVFDDLFGELTDSFGDLEDGGLVFPLLSDRAPELVGQILFSEFAQVPTPLIEFILPEFGLDREQASFEITIPVGPFAAVIEGGFDATFRIGMGISTNGLLQGGELGDSLYLTTTRDEDDNLQALAEFNASLAAGFGVSVPGVRVTVGGGILGEIDAFLSDNDGVSGDGMSHVSDNLFPCLFDPLTGALSAGLNFTFAVGIRPLEWKRTVSVAEIQIVDFSISCSELDNHVEPIVDDSGLASLVGASQLVLNSGSRASLRDVPGDGDTSIHEVFHVRRMTQIPAEGDSGPPFLDVNGDPYDQTALQVDAFGISEIFDGSGVTLLRADGGTGDDTLSIAAGIDVNVRFFGGAGEDLLITGDGDDVVEGGAGNDIISTGDGDDIVRAGGGDDVIRASEGADRIDGDTGQGSGDGIDQVDYSRSDVGVQLLRDGDAVFGFGGLAQGDVLTNIEYLIGTQYDDILSGDDLTSSTLDGEGGNDQLVGSEDNDLLIGGAGGDIMNGRGGDDIASYVNSFGGVQVNLTTGFAFGSDATGDILDRIESLHGSMHGDTLIGDEGANFIDGFAGDDVLEGRAGQDDIRGGGGDDTILALGDGDTLDGGGAITVERDRDLLSYELAAIGVVARLAPTLYDDGVENDDNIQGGQYNPESLTRSLEISSFEDLRGSDHADDLGGDYGNNRIEGGDGVDIIRAFAGNDVVAGGDDADDMYGGLGQDWLDYSASDAGVIVSLEPDEIGQGGDADGDTFTEFENIIGSQFADTLTGDDGDNVFDPLGVSEGAGQDDVHGGNGQDVLRLNYSSLFTNVGLIGGIEEGNPQSGLFSLGDGGFNPQVSFTGIERFEIHGTIQGDILVLGDGDDRIWAGAGDDIVAGGLGGDVIFADDGDDLVFSQIGEVLGDGGGGAFFYLNGGDGYDGLSVDLGDAPNGVSLIMQGGTDQQDDQIATFTHGGVITGFEFIGRVGGTAFADELWQPGRIANEFRTGGGDDIIAPGLGFDAIDGGETPTDPSLLTDADLLILDYSVLDTGTGVLMLPAGEGNVSASRTAGPSPEDPIVDLIGAVNIEYAHITGTNYADVLFGILDPFYDAQGDILRGLDGDDLMQTFNGNDSLFGGAGSDNLGGGADDDRLQGGLAGRDDGIDRLRGESGSDLFILGDRTGQHYGETVEGATTADLAVVEDFVSGQDRVQLVGSAEDYNLIAFGGDTFIQHIDGANLQIIARLDGVTGLDLDSDDFTYVSDIGDVTTFVADGADGSEMADTAASSIPDDLTDTPDAIDPNSPAFEVTQGEPDTNMALIIMQSLSQQGYFISDASITVERSGDARAFGNFENGLGLTSGMVMSTGDVVDLAGLNEDDGGVISHLFGGLTVDLHFEQIGVIGVDGSPMTFYRANLADVPFPIASLVLRDDDDGIGGAAGPRSGADIAGLALTTADFTDIVALTGGDLGALNDPSIFPTLDLFDFSALGTFFTQGSMRSFNPNDLPGAVEAWGDTDGAVAGYVDNGRATLGQFDYNAGSNSGYLSLGDGGQLGLNLTGEIGTNDPVWLIVAEAGGSESFDGTFTASPMGLIPAGDLSTDFGATGAEDDTITYSVEFSVDLGSGGPGPIGNLANSAYVKLFDAVLASEELREFSATELQDSLSIKLNGVEIGYLSDGAAATLERLSLSPVGPYHDDLVLNLAEDAVDSPAATRADGYSLPFSVEGFIVDGVNRLEITLKDTRDGYLDTALLMAAAEDGPDQTPELPTTFGYSTQEDGVLNASLPNSLEAPATYSLPFGAEPSYGTLDLSPNGDFTYTPDADFAGQDSFLYLRVEADGTEVYNVVEINVSGVDDAPVIDDSASYSVLENETDVGMIAASDVDGDALTYTIVGGADAALFSLDPSSGALSFLTAPDFEAPTDADGDNNYQVQVSVSDGETPVQALIEVAVQDAPDTDGITLIGDGMANTLIGTVGDDTIFGRGNNDVLIGGLGDDDLFGEAGNDLLSGDAGDDLIDGGEGRDTVTYESAAGRVVVFLNRPPSDIGGGQGTDTFVSIENVTGSNFNDRIHGDTSDNVIIGLSGNDVLNGLAGDDRLNGAEGDDALTGAGGNDTLLGGDGDDTIQAGLGQDIIQGGAGADQAFGNAGADEINGGAGNDMLVGGNGRDILFGGRGNDIYFGGDDGAAGDGMRDVFVFKSAANGGGGLDIIRDFEDTIDKIDLSESVYTNFADVFADAVQIGANVVINFDGAGVLRIENTLLADLTPGDFLF